MSKVKCQIKSKGPLTSIWELKFICHLDLWILAFEIYSSLGSFKEINPIPLFQSNDSLLPIGSLSKPSS